MARLMAANTETRMESGKFRLVLHCQRILVINDHKEF